MLDGVDLAIEKGSFVVVLGHNGSGKSTLAKTFNGILLPGGGKVYVAGMDTSDEDLLLAIRQHGGHGVPEPGQPDRGQRGGGGRGLRPGEPGGPQPRRSGSGWTRPWRRWA